MRGRRRAICGLDLGGAAPRLALVDHRRGGAEVRLLCALSGADGSLAEGIRRAEAEAALGPSELHVAVPGAYTTCRALWFPAGNRQFLEPAVGGALAALLPFASADTRVAFEILRHEDGGAALVLAAAARAAALDAVTERLGAGGVDPVCMRPAPLAALALIRSLPRLDERALVFLDLAATAPTLAVLAGGVPRLVRALPLPGGADASRLAAEIRLTLAAGGAGTCGGVLLAGGGPAVRVALGRELGTSVTSLGDVEIPGVPAALRSEQGRFAVALGLALAPLRDPGAGVGFPLAPAAASRRRLRSEMARARALVAAAALAALLHAGVGYGVAWHRTRALARALDARLDTLSAAGADAASVDALRHTVARLRRAAASRGRSPTLEVLREVSARIPPGADVVVEGLSLRASLLTLCGTAADAEAAAAVAEDLRASGLLRHVHLDEVTRRADRVTFVLRAAADT